MQINTDPFASRPDAFRFGYAFFFDTFYDGNNGGALVNHYPWTSAAFDNFYAGKEDEFISEREFDAGWNLAYFDNLEHVRKMETSK